MTVELPRLEDQRDFNLQRWEELGRDPELARLPHRLETDRFGRILMSPPPANDHTRRVSRILRRLIALMPEGDALADTAVSTADGVKVTDAAWLAEGRLSELDTGPCLLRAPDVCVEVLSPSNTAAEMDEKRALYLEAGATEVWFCDLDGAMTFHTASGKVARSVVCPAFPPAV